MSIFFLQVREFFVLHRMVGRTWRGVLAPGYFEPCNFPSLIKKSDFSKCANYLPGSTESQEFPEGNSEVKFLGLLTYLYVLGSPGANG